MATTPQPLPRPRTPFFQRARARVRIRDLLREHRLVTLSGVGGSGKSRLALRLAEETVADGGEAAWVPLAPLTDPRLMAAAACTSLGLRPGADVPPLEALVRRLESWRGLLVLDNCEHLRLESRDLAEALLDRCSPLRILTTSREPLRARGEAVWPVPPLALPDRDGEEAEASRFFAQRAAASRPGFRITPDNARAVAALCRRLDGIPLALELAAARVRVLTPEQVLAHLDEGLELLARVDGEGPDRHRTMTAALEWSYGLLGEPDRVLLRRLAVFRGGASLEPCRRVCPGGAVREAEIVDLLGHLVDASLVVVDEADRTARYRLLEPVRRFALDHLERSGEREELEARHAEFFIQLALRWGPELRSADRRAALVRFEVEHDNVRRAWDRSVEAGAWEALARLVRPLFWFWNFGGHFAEGRRRSEKAVGRIPEGSADRLDLLWALGALAWMQGDHDAAERWLEACVNGCRARGREDLLPLALRELAGVRMTLGRLEEAATLYEDSVAQLNGADRSWDRALGLAILADTRYALGDSARAESIRAEARELFSQVGDPWGLSLTHFGIALASAREGDLEAARRHTHEALALHRSAGGDDWNTGQILALLGEIEERAGHPERAGEHLLGSIEAFREVGDRASLSHTLRVLAAAEAARGRTLRAVRLAAAGSPRTPGEETRYLYAIATADDHQDVVRALRRAAGDDAFTEEWALGRAMGVEEAVAFALAGPPPVAHRPAALLRTGSPRLRIFGLGPLEVFRGRRRLRAADWSYALPRELLFYLLLHGPRTKEQIGLDFWPEASRDQLRGRFRTAVYHLRRALGGAEWVRFQDGRYDFERDLEHWFDVEAFRSALEEADRRIASDPRGAADLLQGAVELYRGEFLEGETPGRWASEHQDHLRRRYLEALLRLGDLRDEEGAHQAAVAVYRRALVCDDLNEHAHRALARSLAHAGDRAAAIRQLDELEMLLRSELDAYPSPETLEVRSRLARGQRP